MPEANETPEAENNNPEGQKAAEDVTATEKTKCEIPFFDETASILEDGGEINVILKQLFEACKAKNIPMFAALAYKVEDTGEGYDVHIRGTNTVGKAGFTPNPLNAMKAVSENKALTNLVLDIVYDPVKAGLLNLVGKMQE